MIHEVMCVLALERVSVVLGVMFLLCLECTLCVMFLLCLECTLLCDVPVVFGVYAVV